MLSGPRMIGSVPSPDSCLAREELGCNGHDTANKMKGLLKGLRYISQIFDGKEEEEREMQIGYPTDVKHVAHIGWDGPSVNSPSWMNEFRSSLPVSATVDGDDGGNAPQPKWSPPELNVNGIAIAEMPPREQAPAPAPSPRVSRRLDSSTVGEAPARERRQSRRHQSAGQVSMESPTNETPERSNRRDRRSKASAAAASGGSESSVGELPVIPKQRRKKSTKGSSSGSGSTRLRSKMTFSDPGADGSSPSDRLPSALPTIKSIREEEVF